MHLSVLQYPAALQYLHAVVLVLALSLAGTPAWADAKADKSKAELSALQKKINALNKELNTSREAHRDAADELKDSEKAISEANRKLHEVNQQQKKNREALAALEKQQSALVDTLETQQQLLGKQLYQQYLHGQ